MLAFEKIKNDFNKGNKDWNIFYSLVTYSYNQNPIYNKSGNYSTGFSHGLCHFNFMLKKRLLEFIERINNININFISKNYLDFNYDKLKGNDFVYVDPPYLLAERTYDWSEQDEKMLLSILDKLNKNRVRFVLSNVIEHKDKTNIILSNWINKNDYKIHYINRNYNRINHGENTNSKEILVLNY